MTEDRADALARLGVFIGDWSVEAVFPGQPVAPAGAASNAGLVRSRFKWALDGQFLLQHTQVPFPDAPDSLAIVATDLRTGNYTQHYYDSRGVLRLYAMSFTAGVWTLTRAAADFSALDFRQRFIGTFDAQENTITGAWERAFDVGDWEHDFALTYHRLS